MYINSLLRRYIRFDRLLPIDLFFLLILYTATLKKKNYTIRTYFFDCSKLW